jgi:hypothetical protein
VPRRRHDCRERHYHIKVGEECFDLCLLKEPNSKDLQLLDMLLECQGRRRIRKSKICLYVNCMPPEAFCFSSKALHQFLTENDRLKVLKLSHIKIPDDIRELIGGIQGLDVLELHACVIDVQRLIDALQRNKCGPREIELNCCQRPNTWDPEVHFSSIFVPLLKSARLKALYLIGMPFPCASRRAENFSSIKEACESNQSLETLFIDTGPCIRQTEDLKLLFQGIAATPKLRSLHFNLPDATSRHALSPRQMSEMFASALKDCQNSSLESVKTFFIGSNCRYNEIWNREVIPILQFNRERRRFDENTMGRTHNERLTRALRMAKRTDNHHLLFWLVRNHTGNINSMPA